MTRTEHIDGTQLAPFNRPRTGRVLAGVALAVATRLELPLWVIRLSFVILVGFGGVGILLYLAGWALIPAEGDTRAVAGRFLDRIEGPRAWIGVGLMALAAVVVAESSRILDADIVVAGILVLVGVLLYRGDIGSPRSSTQEERTNMPSTYSTLAAEGDSTLTGGEPTLTGEEPPTSPPAPPQAPVPAAPMPPPPPRPPKERSILGRVTVAVVLITLGVLAAIDNIGNIDVSMRHYVGAAMLVVGVGLLVGAVAGRARGLIILGVMLVPPLLASPIADLDFGDTDVRITPESVSDIESSYSHDVGSFVIDLTDVDFAGATVEINADLGLGELEVIVPDDITVEAYGEVAIGEVNVFGITSGGIGEISRRGSVDGTDGNLRVDARVDIGSVNIVVEGEATNTGEAPFGDISVTAVDAFDLDPVYELGAGSMVLDLSGLRLETEREVRIDVGTGDVRVILPTSIDTEVDAEVGIGDLVLPDGRHSGLGRDGTYSTGPNPLLTLIIEVGAGEILIEELR